MEVWVCQHVLVWNKHFWLTVLSVAPLVQCGVCDVLYCGETVHSSWKLSEGANRKPRLKSWCFGIAAVFLLPVSFLRPPRRPFLPYFCRTAQRSILDGTNGLWSSKPCAHCRIVQSELKPVVVFKVQKMAWYASAMLATAGLLVSGSSRHFSTSLIIATAIWGHR